MTRCPLCVGDKFAVAVGRLYSTLAFHKSVRTDDFLPPSFPKERADFKQVHLLFCCNLFFHLTPTVPH